MKFHGPTTLILQSRASRVSEVLTARDSAEIADSQPDLTESMTDAQKQVKELNPSGKGAKLNTARRGSDGRITIEAS